MKQSLLLTTILLSLFLRSSFANLPAKIPPRPGKVYAPGCFNNALSLDGESDNYVNISGVGETSFANTVTLEAWVYPTDVSGERSIIARGDAADGYGVAFGIKDGAIWVGGSGIYAGNWILSTLGTISANEWTHVAAVFNKTSNTITVYKNGVYLGSYVPPYSFSLNEVNESDVFNTHIGRNHNRDLQHFVGSIDEIRIWNTERTAVQLNTGMYAELAGNETGLLAYYKLNNATAIGTAQGTAVINNATAAGSPGAAANGATVGTVSFIENDYNCSAPPATGCITGAITFNGAYSYEYVKVGNMGSFPDHGSISFWMKPNVRQDGYYNNPLTTGGLASGNHGVRFEFNPDGTFSVVYGNPNGDLTGINAGKPFSTEWQHVTTTWDKPNNRISFYIDGVLVGTSTNSNWPTELLDVIIGCGYHVYRTFSGSLDDVAFWDKTLTDTEVKGIVSTPMHGAETALRAFYPMNEAGTGVGIIVHDIASADPNTYNGTTKYSDDGQTSGGNVNFNSAHTYLPIKPSHFTQSSVDVATGQNGVVYNVPNMPGYTYSWSYTGTGATGTEGTGNSVTLNFSNTATSGTLSVTAINSCGTSAALTMEVNVGSAGISATTNPVINLGCLHPVNFTSYGYTGNVVVELVRKYTITENPWAPGYPPALGTHSEVISSINASGPGSSVSLAIPVALINSGDLMTVSHPVSGMYYKTITDGYVIRVRSEDGSVTQDFSVTIGSVPCTVFSSFSLNNKEFCSENTIAVTYQRNTAFNDLSVTLMNDETGASVHTWTSLGNPASPFELVLPADLLFGTKYYLLFTDGATSERSSYLKIGNPIPVLSATPNPVLEEGTLSLSVSGITGSYYRDSYVTWQKFDGTSWNTLSATNVSGSSSNYDKSLITAADAGSYRISTAPYYWEGSFTNFLEGYPKVCPVISNEVTVTVSTATVKEVTLQNANHTVVTPNNNDWLNTNLCPGSTAYVDFTRGLLNAGTSFKIILSGQNSNFDSGTTILADNITSTTGPVQVTIPVDVIHGPNYSIRVESSDPVHTATSLGVYYFGFPTQMTASPSQICVGATVNFYDYYASYYHGSTYFDVSLLKDGNATGLLPNETNVFSKSNTSLVDAGIYSIDVERKSDGCVTRTAETTLIVNPLPTSPILTASQTTINGGESVTIFIDPNYNSGGFSNLKLPDGSQTYAGTTSGPWTYNTSSLAQNTIFQSWNSDYYTGCVSPTVSITITVNGPTDCHTALDFDGTDDKVRISLGDAFSQTSYTMETWARIDKTSGANVFYSSASRWMYHTQNYWYTNALVIGFAPQGGGPNADAVYSLEGMGLDLSQYHHYAGTYDDGTKTFHFYIDGVEHPDGAKTFAGAGSPIVNIEAFLGTDYNNPTYSYTSLDGALDEFRIWGNVRDQSQIAANKDKELTGSEPGLLLYYKFNDNCANNIQDYSANGLQGIRTGTTSWNNTPQFVSFPVPLANASCEPVKLNIIPVVSNSGPVCEGEPVELTVGGLAPRGKALNLNASNSEAVTVYHTLTGTDATAEMWIKTSQANMGIFEFFSYGSVPNNWNNQGRFALDASGQLIIGWDWNVGEVNTGVVLNDGKWHHLAMSSSNSSVAVIYVDGNAIYSFPSPYGFNNWGQQGFTIGYSRTLGHFTGQIDNVRVWDVSRTLFQMRESMYLDDPASTTNLIASYKFEDNLNSENGGPAGTAYNTVGYQDVNSLYTFTWTGDNAPEASANETVVTTGAAGESYSVSVSMDGTTCESVATQNPVTIRPLPTGFITAGAASCSGGSSSDITFTGNLGTAPYTFIYKLNESGVEQTVSTAGTASSVSITPPPLQEGDKYILVSASDANGCSQILNTTTVVDVSSPPAFTSCPTNQTVTAVTGTCAAVVTYASSVVVTGFPAPTLSYTFSGATVRTGNGTGSGQTFNTGTTHVVIKATNPCSTAGILCEFDVIVTDMQKPALSVATAHNVNLGAGCALIIPNLVSGANATDNCSTVTITQFPTAGTVVSSSHNGTVTVTVTATDGSDNTDSKVVTLTGKDVTAPVARVFPEISEACSVTVSAALADDNCDGVITGTTSYATTINTPGYYGIYWTFVDSHGNTSYAWQYVTVSNPTMTAPVLADLTGDCSVTVTTAPTIMDNCGNVITGTTTFTLPRTFNSTPASPIAWSFYSPYIGYVYANQNVVVGLTTPPVAPILAALTGECSVTIPNASLPTTLDNCGRTITGTTNDPLAYTAVGDYVIHWQFKDVNNNIATATQDVHVVDNTAPPTPTLNTVSGNCTVTVTRPNVIDNCAGTILGQTTDPLIYNTVGTYTIHWTFTDPSGHSSTANQTVQVNAVDVPTVVLPANALYCTGQSVATKLLSGTPTGVRFDISGGSSIGLSDVTGATAIPPFTATNNTASPITVTISITPKTNCGIGTVQTFTITVNPIPTMTDPSDIVACSGSTITPANFVAAFGGTSFNWTNNNTSIGLAASGAGNIPAFTTTDYTFVNTATITVTPVNGCNGTPQTFTITVNPTPKVYNPGNKEFCAGPVTEVLFSSPVTGTTYTWVNDNMAIGLGASGSGDLPAFTAVNNGTTPAVAHITVTASHANGCPGASETFTISVNPIAGLTDFGDVATVTIVSGSNDIISNCSFVGKLSSPSIAASAAPTVTVSTTNVGGVRKYEITPAGGSAFAADLVLYFSQADFDAFGGLGSLPSGPTDSHGISNLRIVQTSSSGSETIDPLDENVVWNGTKGWWEITFSVSHFSTFELSTSAALPVTLVNFKATKLEQSALLSWSTVAESNSESFDIQHSLDGRNWETVGVVKAKGESNSLVSYSYIHDNPFKGENLYRLKMVDRASDRGDAIFAYSRIVSLNFQSGETFSVFPNPATDRLELDASDWTMVNSVNIVDINGRTVYRSAQEGLSRIINVKSLPSGVYVVEMSRTNGHVNTRKIVIIR